MEIVGWIGSLLFSFCAVPQSLQSYKKGHSEGLSLYFLLMWFFGEVLTLIYTFSLEGKTLPLIFNYIFNLLCLLVIFYYYLFPRKEDFYGEEKN